MLDPFFEHQVNLESSPKINTQVLSGVKNVKIVGLVADAKYGKVAVGIYFYYLLEICLDRFHVRQRESFKLYFLFILRLLLLLFCKLLKGLLVN